MENQEKILLIVTVALALFAVYLAIGGGAAPQGSEEARGVLMKGLGFGADQAGSDSNYIYSFEETTNGYKATYLLAKNGNQSSLEVQNPLSTKSVYFLSDDTVLCIAYPPFNETCSSVQNYTDLGNYLSSLRVKFFDAQLIQRNKDDVTYLLDKGYLKFSSQPVETSVLGRNCTEISYFMDLSNITLDEATRFGVSASSPKAFNWTMCVDNESGEVYRKTFNYSVQGVPQEFTYTLLSFRPGAAGLITSPENLTDGAVDILLSEKEQQGKLGVCYTGKQGEERDRCLSNVALDLHRRDLCELSGSWRDRCLVALVPLTKDLSICAAIAQQSYRDDCNIELAGAYKNSSYCSYLQNASKVQFCMEVSQPAQQNANATGNASPPANTSDINQFMNEIDQVADNVTNVSGG